jgi:ribosomal protein S18 acetylase RimI-like enzyme
VSIYGFVLFQVNTFFYLGKQENYHGHVTALSIAPEFRRIGVSSQLMVLLEKVSEQLIILSLYSLIIIYFNE